MSGSLQSGVKGMSMQSGELPTLVMREDELTRIIANRLEKIFKIIENTDTPYFFIDQNVFTDLEKAGLFLLTKYLSWKLGFSNIDGASIDWLEIQTGLKRNVIISRLKDLRDLGWVERSGDIYRIKLSSINKIIERVEKRLE